MEMFGSGAAIGMVAIQRVCCETLRALRMARYGSTVAEAGTTTAGTCDRRTGTGTRRTTGTTTWAFASAPGEFALYWHLCLGTRPSPVVTLSGDKRSSPCRMPVGWAPDGVIAENFL